MIYSNMLKLKFRNLLRAFVLLLMAVFTMNLYSCETTYIEKYYPENFKTDDDIKILDITTKNDSLINLANCESKYSPALNKEEDAIIISKADTTLVKKGPLKEYRIKYENSKINLRDILSANVQKSKTDVPLTMLTIFGAVAIIGIIVLVILSSLDYSFRSFH